jgi:ubiquinone/menaquinone biosynthesis C-methylase UbiE
MSDVENKTGALFGGLWGELTDEQYQDSVELFAKRAISNNFDLNWIKGKKCLDAGCGSGRYSVAMALHGADSIDAIDVSETGISEASRRAEKFENINFKHASVLDIPFEDGVFDFVWSCGVIHHTSDFDKALSELTRVLKVGGKLYLLIYGTGGLSWQIIKALRPIVADLGEKFIDEAISVAGLPANNRKNFMDHLFVPVQKLTSFQEIYTKLDALGYSGIDRWTGESYDHESTPAAQLEDIKKLKSITRACTNLATTTTQNYLAELAYKMASLYVDTAHKAISDKSISPTELHDIMIGEGNHRIIATML